MAVFSGSSIKQMAKAMNTQVYLIWPFHNLTMCLLIMTQGDTSGTHQLNQER